MGINFKFKISINQMIFLFFLTVVSSVTYPCNVISVTRPSGALVVVIMTGQHLVLGVIKMVKILHFMDFFFFVLGSG